MVARIPVKPDVLAWAVARSGIDHEELIGKYPQLDAWLSEEIIPTFNQLQKFANTVHTSLGYLFLETPPREELPIADFRTIKNAALETHSPALMETIHICQRRQGWYREHAISEGLDKLPFVGSFSGDEDASFVADVIRRAIKFSMADRARYPTWEAALRQLIDNIEDIGVLVMVNGVVGENTRRPLNPEEFRGFALTDPYAPLIFVNGKDSKAAQIFTLVHEMTHIYAGESGVSDARMNSDSLVVSEIRANRVAAEILVPLEHIREIHQDKYDADELQRLARIYKVSTLVVLTRLKDVGVVPRERFQDAFDIELERVKKIAQKQRGKGGGNYYYSQPLKISRAFARAVVAEALEGKTLYRDAYSLLGASKHETFMGMAQELGVG